MVVVARFRAAAVLKLSGCCPFGDCPFCAATWSVVSVDIGCSFLQMIFRVD